MWKWLEKSKGIKADLLNFKKEPLSGLSIVLLIVLDIFIFTNIIIGVEGETAKVPSLYYYYPSECSKHFEKVQTEYTAFENYRYGRTRAAHLRPHLSSFCQELDAKIELFTLKEEFKERLAHIREIEQKQRQNRQRLDQISQQYNTRLFERIAQMPGNAELGNAKKEYDAIIEDEAHLKEERESIPALSGMEGYRGYAAYVTQNRNAFDAAKASYRFWQPFKEYGHMLLFILPLLLFFGYFYYRTKQRELMAQAYNPVVKIISTHISLLLALPLVWYTLGLVYHVLPKTLLKEFVEFLVRIGLISLLNYFAILLVVFVFGALIYWIQKRTLRKREAVVYQKNYKKLISWSQCFECEYKIDYTKAFCPFCGVGLHTKCAECGAEMIRHEVFCSRCGRETSS